MRRVAVVLVLALLVVPATSFGQATRQVPQKISFDFVDADVRNVLRIFAEISKKNMIIGEDVKGKVTIKLEDLSYDEALEVILKTNGLSKVEEDNVVRIMTSKALSAERDREAKERLDFLKEREARQKLEEELVTETVFINYADPEEVEKMIRGESTVTAAATAPAGAASAGSASPMVVQRGKGLLSSSGIITLVRWNSALIIRDTKDSVERIVKLIREHDIPPQQVQIEARIVQANTTFSKDLGVEWNASRSTGQSNPAGVSTNVSPGAPSSPAGSLSFFIGTAANSFHLSATLAALENQGKGKIISSPKVITADNRPAKITQGQQIPYLNSSSTQGATVEFKDAVLELEVTPHIAKDGNVRLTIKAKKDQVNWANTIQGNPPIDKREATTELLVKDGETAVIGGIYEVERSDADAGVPALRRVPLLGWLFKRTTKTDNRTELLIFVTPTIIKNLYTEKRDR
jgi:type IV pilus assembly protein PilQ